MGYSSIIKNCKNTRTNHLLTLCEILDDYESFCTDLESLVKTKNNRKLVNSIYNAMQKKTSIGSNRYKDFIEKHKHTLEIMYTYSTINYFTMIVFDEHGKRRENLSEDYFYQYIQKHKNDLETIRKVILKIKDLEIDTINFDDELDFTKMEYEINNFNRSYFAFLENMEVKPNYLRNQIKYKTNESNYCLILEIDTIGNHKEINKYNRCIELNNLIFDPDKLPAEITVESTFGKIRQLSEKKLVEHTEIHNSVCLSVAINDLRDYFERLKTVIKGINKIKDDEELSNLLTEIQDAILKLQLFNKNFDSQLIESYISITDELIQKEKQLYLSRRHWTDIDID